MLGRNHRVRKTPVRSSTKLHRAISPSMNDQWSGKTLRSCFLPRPARPRRSSAQPAAAPTFDGFFALAGVAPLVPATLVCVLIVLSRSRLVVVALPETGADSLGEVTRRDQVTLVVEGHGPRGQVPGSGG